MRNIILKLVYISLAFCLLLYALLIRFKIAPQSIDISNDARYIAIIVLMISGFYFLTKLLGKES